MSRHDIPAEYWDAPPEPYEGAFFDAFMGAVTEAAEKAPRTCTCPALEIGLHGHRSACPLSQSKPDEGDLTP